MEFPISRLSAARRILLGSLSLAVIGLYLAAVTQIYRAARYEESADPQQWQKASRLDPGNAEYRYRLGRYFLVDGDAAVAANQYRAAVQLNPHIAQYWLGLAGASRVLSDAKGERDALIQAGLVEPTTPNVAWEVGNYYLTGHRPADALRQFRVVLEATDLHDTASIRNILRLGLRASDDFPTVLDTGVPPRPEIYLVLLGLLTEKDDASDSAMVWSRLVGLHQRISPGAAFPYLDYLIRKQEVDRAWQCWTELARLTPELAAYLPKDNLIVNGGFEEEILNGGFDWRQAPSGDVSFAIDTNDFHSGIRSLSVAFGRGDLFASTSDTGLFQLVRVRPDTRYEMSAFVKSDIQSAAGPRLILEDAFTGQQLGVTDEINGTASWHQVTVRFTTGPGTQLVKLALRRLQGNQLIRGRMWLDDFTLTSIDRQ